MKSAEEKNKPNPNWIRTILSTLVLAFLLNVGLRVPFFTTFLVVSIIYVMHVVLTEMETNSGGWKWVKSTGNVATGVAIFLALRLIAGKALGLYPIDTFETLTGKSGGLIEGVLFGRNFSNVILWEILFAFIGGGLTVAYIRGQNKIILKGIFTISFFIIIIQIAYPSYTAKWPTSDVVATNLDSNGFLGTGWKAAKRLAVGRPTPPSTNSVTPSASARATIRQVVQMPDQTTPCEIDIAEIRDIYTDGEAVYILPPEWSTEKAILYSGKGHLVIQGGNIHAGKWKFWSADSNKVVLIRIFVMK